MITLFVALNGEGAWSDLKDRKDLIEVTDPIQVAVLKGGMASGLPSVAIRVNLPDGRTVIAQTSARIFVQVAAAIRARYPEVDS